MSGCACVCGGSREGGAVLTVNRLVHELMYQFKSGIV
jgi:hypothetical protein